MKRNKPPLIALFSLCFVALMNLSNAQTINGLDLPKNLESTAIGMVLFDAEPVECPEPQEEEASIVCFGPPNQDLITTKRLVDERMNPLFPDWPRDWDMAEVGYVTTIFTQHDWYFIFVSEEALAITTPTINEADAGTDAVEGTTNPEATEPGTSSESNGGSASAEEVPSEDEVLRSCILEHVDLEAQLVPQSWGSGFDVELTIENRLSWAIAAIQVEFEIRSPDRSVPWSDGSPSQQIAGGIEPSETRSVTTSALLPDIALDEELVVEARLLDVADADMNLFVADQLVMGWGMEPSTRPCPPSP